ncbi:hypothetical protein F5Y15DRAFT_365948 [Xylariaceae sp. FL0016]|nr:hypothetical protein F5Y15DRAFT_365948 [Xylariaceae sp. FL0016]
MMDWSPPGALPSQVLNPGVFRFCPGTDCLIQIVELYQDPKGIVQRVKKSFVCEQDYSTWVKSHEPLEKSNGSPSFTLVMHRRLPGEDMRATDLPYKEDTFQSTHKSLYQHKSLSLLLGRISTSVFNYRSVDGPSEITRGQALVYNCKSDDTSPTTDDDFALSITYFSGQPMIFAVAYGCTSDTMRYIVRTLKEAQSSAFHPLVLPLMFVELERKRFLNAVDRKGADLRQRVLDIENRLSREGARKSEQSEKFDESRSLTEKDCEATKLWGSVSSLKNALESLNAQIHAMTRHCELLTQDTFAAEKGCPDVFKNIREFGIRIGSRLDEMSREIDSKVRDCEGLLGGMSLATSMERNYHSRRDARATIIIAVASKKDSSQMRYISYLGMIFLPGTFLATLFSMTFFNWTSDESNQVISPWVAVYFATAIVFTGITVWRFKKWCREADQDAEDYIYKELDSEPGSKV